MLCLVLMPAASVLASSGFDLVGSGARSSAMGSAGVTTADDFSAVYYNPASMVLGRSTVGAGLFFTFDDAVIRLADRPPGYDLPDLGINSPAIPSIYRVRDRQDFNGLDMLVGFYAGATTDMGVENLRLGVIGMAPLNQLGSQQTFFADEREQFFSNQLHFDLIGDRIYQQIIMLAAGYRIFDWLAFGAGVSLNFATTTNNNVYLHDATNQSALDLNLDMRLDYRASPTLGLLFWPYRTLRMGASFRGEQYFSVQGRNEIQTRGLHETEDFPVYQDFNLILQYSPPQLAIGGSWQNDQVLVSLDLTYSLWSHYPNNHGQEAGFEDTVTPRAGTEIRLSDIHFLRLGVVYHPSPVPPQTGRTNYVDNSRLVGTAGMGHRLQVLDSRLILSWFFQFHYLMPRTELKEALDEYPVCAPGVTALCDEVPDNTVDPATGQQIEEALGLQTGNPGFPGYSSGGWLALTGIEIAWEF